MTFTKKQLALLAFGAAAAASPMLGGCSNNDPIVATYKACPDNVDCPLTDGQRERWVNTPVMPPGDQIGFVCSIQNRQFKDAFGNWRFIRDKWGNIPWMYNADNPRDDGKGNPEGNWQMCDQNVPAKGAWERKAAQVWVYIDNNGVILATKRKEYSGNVFPGMEIRHKVPAGYR